MTTPKQTHPKVRQNIITNVDAPRMRLRELYDKQVGERNKEPNSHIIPISLKASVDDEDLQVLIATGCIPVTFINDLNEQQILE